LGQAGISTLYYPKQDREIHSVLQGWAINQGYSIGWNQLKEFSGDIGAFVRRYSKKNKSKQATEVSDSRSPLNCGQLAAGF
jgi:hypothetical protein